MVLTGADSDLHKAARAKRKPVTVGDMRRRPERIRGSNESLASSAFV